MRLLISFVLSGIALPAWAQTSEAAKDTTRLLDAVVVEAFQTDRELSEVPASVAVLGSSQLERFNNTSLLPAVNVVPGVRMEERSPGSYRFSIRGSSLRSPFGVRNVKVYWNGLPFTDAGGNTYLNLLDFGSVGSMEIIKGPGGSLYGAGTGGVLLLKSEPSDSDRLEASAVVGSYGLQRYQLEGQVSNDRLQASLQLASHRSEGYRAQTELGRTFVNANIKALAGSKGAVSATLLYSDLSYGTPGGLTLAEFQADPRQARPRTGLPGAVEAKAAVTNETVYGGVTYDHEWDQQWNTSTGIYGAFSTFENPTIRNYEDRDETNFGARSTTEYIWREQGNRANKITFGGEFQYFVSPIAVFDNDGVGNPAALQVRDEITSKAGLLFGQADFELPGEFFITAGGSVNFLTYDFVRLEPAPKVEQTRSFQAVVSPRLALLKKFSNALSAFASYSNGFSPPSVAEVRPSTNTFSKSLKPERGNNLEIGARGTLLNEKISYDVVWYDFRLRNTIIVQRNEEGADYFTNAGSTSQRGIEAYFSWDVVEKENGTSALRFWGSYAYQHYRFRNYAPLDEDYSGNALTGVAPTIVSAGADARFLQRFSANLTLNYVDHIPLNDANTAFADAYVLVGLRAGWNTTLGQSGGLQVFAGVDNALDEKYSLGNDLNAFGGRYYNPAMPRNYYAGVSISIGQGN